MQDTKRIFNQVLKWLSEKELREFIGKYCKTNAMQNKFLTHFSHKIEIKAEKNFKYDGGEVFDKKIYRHIKQKDTNRLALLKEMSMLSIVHK